MATLTTEMFEDKASYARLFGDNANNLVLLMGHPPKQIEGLSGQFVTIDALIVLIFKNGDTFGYWGASVLYPQVEDFEYIGKIGDILK